jgi:hypothetical protein
LAPLTSTVSAVDTGVCANGQSIADGIDCASGGGSKSTLFGEGSIFTTVVNTLLFIIGAISVIMLIVGGFRYTVSGGTAASVTGAKNTIVYALIGLVVAFLAYAIVNWVLTAVS